MNFPQNTSFSPLALLCLVAFSYWSFVILPSNSPSSLMEEICDNALDDDEDGLVDLNDPDCECEVIEPVSLIPNPSFEEMNCCPEDRSQLDCATGWVQASEPTTDYLHTCGWMGWEDFPPPQPFPDGEGIMGFRDGRVRNGLDPEPGWKEYAGACLAQPMLAGVTYRFEFEVGFVSFASSPPIYITFFGTDDCDNIPFGQGDEFFGCPTNGPGWQELGKVHVSGGPGNKWVETFIEVTPETNISAIAIGPDCPNSTNPTSTYYFFDNLVLADEESFDYEISEITHPCDEDFLLEVPPNDELDYQWYLDGVALIGETESAISQMYGEGGYQVQVIDEEGFCRVTQFYNRQIPVTTTYISEAICNEDVYLFGLEQISMSGTYIDTFKTVDNCDSIVTLDLEVLGFINDTINARIFEGEQFEVGSNSYDQEGVYTANLVSSLGCDSLVLLDLSFYNVFIPNVFSPNFDGINDYFEIYGQDADFLETKLSVYDRWGALLYTGIEWDGNSRGNPVNPGVYIYIFQVTMSDGKERQFSGSVTVLR